MKYGRRKPPLPSVAWERLFASLGSIYELTALQDYPEKLVELVRGLVPCDMVTYNVVDLRRSSYHFFADPPDALPRTLEPAFFRHLDEHPMLAYAQEHGTGEAVMFSDFLSQRQLHNLVLYAEFFRPIRIEHQVVFSMVRPGEAVIGVSLNRSSSPFTETERQLLELLRPHWERSYSNVVTFDTLRAAAGAGNREIVMLSSSDRIASASNRALQWLTDYFGGYEATCGRLPRELMDWLRQQRLAFCHHPGGAIRRTQMLRIQREEGILILRYLGRDFATGQECIVLVAAPGYLPPDSMEELGLTQREAQIMTLVGQGLSNTNIGEQLFISPRTVQTHLERVYEKLGVADRTVAAVRIQQLSGRLPAKLLAGEKWRTYSLNALT